MPTVITELNQEWTALISQGRTASQIDHWVDQWPALRPLLSPGAGKDNVHLRDRAEADRVLLALLTAHHAGDYTAGRLVLQCMLSAVARIAGRCKHRFDDLEDATTEATAAMWSAIATFDLTCTQGIATKLWSRCFDALASRKVRAHAPRTHEIPADHDTMDALGSSVLSPAVDDGDSILGTTGEVLEVIAVGLDAGVLTPDEASLLTRLYAPDPSLPEYAELADPRGNYQRMVANELGQSFDAMRKRASRAVKKLALAVEAGL